MWFDSANSRALAERLRNEYEVNGQTAWALLTKAERYRVCLVSELPDEQVKLMRMTPVRSIAEALEGASDRTGFIMPRGAAIFASERATARRRSDAHCRGAAASFDVRGGCIFLDARGALGRRVKETVCRRERSRAFRRSPHSCRSR